VDVEEKPKARRGRPPKARGGVPRLRAVGASARPAEALAEAAPPPGSAVAAEEQPKARRGRPPKQKPPAAEGRGSTPARTTAAVEEPFETPKPEPPEEDLTPKKGRRQLSPEARARIVAAQKARWAKKKGTGTEAEGNEETAPSGKMAAVETAELPVGAPSADAAEGEEGRPSPPSLLRSFGTAARTATPAGKKRGRKPKATKVVTDEAPPPEPEAPSETEDAPPVSE
jgi:hypothetical protein